MKRPTREWVKKAEADFRGARSLARQTPSLHDLVCFHSQQCAEKYLKALLEELGIAIAKSYDLEKLLAVLQSIIQDSFASAWPALPDRICG